MNELLYKHAKRANICAKLDSQISSQAVSHRLGMSCFSDFTARVYSVILLVLKVI